MVNHNRFNTILLYLLYNYSGGSKGGARDACPPWGPKFFHFHVVFDQKIGLCTHFESWHPPGENPGSATELYNKIMKFVVMACDTLKERASNN